MFVKILFFSGVSLFILPVVFGQFEDRRCKCFCPNANLMFPSLNLTDRNLYIKIAGDRSECNCQSMVTGIPEDKKGEFCAKCECVFQQRNTTTIKVVVILVICVMGMLVVYLLFLLCLDPMLKQPRKDHPYERQNDEDNIFARSDAISATSLDNVVPTDARLRRPSEGGVLNKVEQQQNKWFAKVHEQRRKIFTDHTMLN